MFFVVLFNKEKRKNMGNAGRKFVEENFSWDKIAKEFINNLEEVGIK